MGRVFLCINGKDGARRLMMIRQSVDKEGGNKRRYFDFVDLPDYIRIVKISEPSEHFVNVIPEGLIETDGKPKLVEQMEQEDSINEKLDAIFRELHSLGCGVKLLGEVHNNAHAAVLDHFKQIHEQENWLQEHQTRAEDRLMNHIQECCDKAMLTTNTCSDDIIRALPELEDRIKECIGKPDPAQPSTAGNAPSGQSSNQVLLRALDVLEYAIKK